MSNDNMAGMTIEGFFLQDYARVKAELEVERSRADELEKKVEKMTSDQDGFTDLHQPVDLVYMWTNDSIYDMRRWAKEYANGHPLDGDAVREVAQLDDEKLLTFAKKARTSSYGGDLLRIERHRYPFTVSFSTYKGEHVYAYDPDKDSIGLVKFIDKVDCEFVHSLTTADAPQTVTHVKRTFARLEGSGFKCHVQQPYYKGERTSMWKLIPQKKYPPTRLARYCCDVLKETSGKHRMCALGVRKDESNARKARGEFEVIFKDKARRGSWDFDAASEAIASARELPEVFDCNLVTNMKQAGKTVVNPLIAWTDDDVWSFLNDNHVDVCDLYGMGYKRVGCICCPFGGFASMRREGRDFPKYKRAYIRAFEKMIGARKANGMNCDWKTGEEVWHWWVRDGVLPGQQEIDFNEEDE